MSRVIPGDGKSRQAKKDEQIRRKLLIELGKRKNRYTTIPDPKEPIRIPPPNPNRSGSGSGSVLNLKPVKTLSILHNAPIIEAGQYMAAYKSTCCLVLDDNGTVCGVLSNKDLVLKAMIKPIAIQKTMKVADIMSADPVCANTGTTAMDALNIMASHDFRHMPVLSENDEVIGVLDISRCFFEAMRRLEKVTENSQQFQEVLNNVYSDMDEASVGQISNFMDVFKEKTHDTSLESVMTSAPPPLCVESTATVADVLLLMVENQASAVVITNDYKPMGIFTTKDAVLRVLAPNINPSTCSIVRVMTSNPQCASLSMNISEALRIMHDDHVLNLPVKDAEGYIIGIVDVLFLTRETLSKLNQLSKLNEGEEQQPEWNKFLLSLDDVQDETVAVGDASGHISDTELAEFTLPEGLAESYNEHTVSEISNSFFEPIDSFDSVLPEDSASQYEKSQLDADSSYVFKLKTPNGTIHRIPVRLVTSINNFRSLILSKLTSAELMGLGGSDAIKINYVDKEGDVVCITCEQDIIEATRSAQRASEDVVQLLVEGKSESGSVFPYLLAGSAIAIGIGFYMLRHKK